MFVMTIDQKSSRSSEDRVPELLAYLSDVRAERGFERSVGDEIQGVLSSAEAVVEVAMRCLRQGHWYVGIGIGQVDNPLPPSPREGSGNAFVLARDAVELAKKTGDRTAVSVAAENLQLGEAAEAVLVLVGALVRKRSQAEWRILDTLAKPEAKYQRDVARMLGISTQAVNQAIARSGLQEEQAGRRAAALLLDLADSR